MGKLAPPLKLLGGGGGGGGGAGPLPPPPPPLPTPMRHKWGYNKRRIGCRSGDGGIQSGTLYY